MFSKIISKNLSRIPLSIKVSSNLLLQNSFSVSSIIEFSEPIEDYLKDVEV